MKLTKEQWLIKGIDILTRFGAEQIKVDSLCKYIGVTKGSFYHHFKNRSEYINELLLYWQDENTKGIIAKANEGKSSGDKSDILDSLAMAADVGPERAIRSWGQYDNNVGEFVKKVDLQRINYLEMLISSQNSEQLVDANLVAKLAYAHFVGCQQLTGVIDKQEWTDMSLLLRQMFTDKTEK